MSPSIHATATSPIPAERRDDARSSPPCTSEINGCRAWIRTRIKGSKVPVTSSKEDQLRCISGAADVGTDSEDRDSFSVLRAPCV